MFAISDIKQNKKDLLWEYPNSQNEDEDEEERMTGSSSSSDVDEDNLGGNYCVHNEKKRTRLDWMDGWMDEWTDLGAALNQITILPKYN